MCLWSWNNNIGMREKLKSHNTHMWECGVAVRKTHTHASWTSKKEKKFLFAAIPRLFNSREKIVLAHTRLPSSSCWTFVPSSILLLLLASIASIGSN